MRAGEQEGGRESRRAEGQAGWRAGVEVGVGVEVTGWAWEARTRGPLGSSSVPPA